MQTKQERSAYMKEWRKINKDKIKKYALEYYHKIIKNDSEKKKKQYVRSQIYLMTHPGYNAEKTKRYIKKDPEAQKKRQKAWLQKIKSDPIRRAQQLEKQRERYRIRKTKTPSLFPQ